MTQLYLVRHGETDWSKSGQHTSYTDLNLTENGVGEALKLREKLDPADTTAPTPPTPPTA